MAMLRASMWGLMLAALCFGGCSAATDDPGPAPEPAESVGEGLSCAVLLCIEHGNSARCVKPKHEKAADPCATVKCKAGYHCEPIDGSASCEPTLCKAPDGCGPALGMPNTLCDDGVNYSGPTGNCLDLGGQCGWEVLSCP